MGSRKRDKAMGTKVGGGEEGDGVTPPPKLNNMYISKVDLKILKLKKIFSKTLMILDIWLGKRSHHLPSPFKNMSKNASIVIF